MASGDYPPFQLGKSRFDQVNVCMLKGATRVSNGPFFSVISSLASSPLFPVD